MVMHKAMSPCDQSCFGASSGDPYCETISEKLASASGALNAVFGQPFNSLREWLHTVWNTVFSIIPKQGALNNIPDDNLGSLSCRQCTCRILVVFLVIFGSASSAHSLTLQSLGTPYLVTDGSCNATTPSIFGLNYSVTVTNNDIDTNDPFRFYLLDANSTVLSSSGKNWSTSFGQPSISSSTQSQTLVTPAAGPFRFVLHDDTDFTANFADGATFDATGLSILADNAFDAQALDPDCPAGGSSNTAPTITSSASAAVAENQSAAIDVQTTDDNDAEGAGLTYSKTGGADQALFNLDGSSGVLTFITAPDFEAPGDVGGNNVYDVQVTVTDSGSLTDVQDIAITVTDVDEIAPTVEILGAPAVISGVDPFVVTVEFSEDVLNFVSGDVSVANGSVTGFSAIDGNTYEVTITPSGAGEVTIEVAAAVANDAAGNDNTAATPVTIGNTIIEDTQKVIASFMLNRANHILSNQPDLIGYLEGTNTGGGGPLGNLNINGNEDGMNLAFSSSLSKIDRARAESLEQLATRRVGDAHIDPNDLASRDLDRLLPPQNGLEQVDALTLAARTQTATYGADLVNGVEATPQAGYSDMPDRRYDIWTEIYGSTSNTGDYDSNFWVGYLGAHYFVTPNMIVGGLVQFDWAEEENDVTGSSVDGHGWMIGPYIAGRIAGTKLSYEARAAWGQSDNNVSPLGTYTDDFETERWLASFKLKGNYKLDTITFRPSVSVSYFEEEQKSYTDSLTNKIPSQTISLGEVRFGPEFIQDIALADGSLLQPSIGVSGIWNFGVDEGANTQGYALGNNDLRARVDAGFSLTNPNGMVFSASAFYDGLGIEDYESMGGKVRLSVPIR
jgi:hypothetical protein